jgi:ABC-2 type transport system permease protein
MVLVRPSALHMIGVHYRMMTTMLLRMPAHLMPSLAFPAMLFLVFALPRSHDVETSTMFLVNFSIFAVLAIVLFQFGIGIAGERTSPWEQYVRTLPATAAERMAARTLVALSFALAAVIVMTVLAVTLTHPALTPQSWLSFVGAILIGAVPFSALGIAIGYLTGPRSAIPIANLIYLPISYLGGILTPLSMIPEPLLRLSPFTPTRQYGELVKAVVLGVQPPSWAVFGLIGYTIVFTAIALFAYRRDEGGRFV